MMRPFHPFGSKVFLINNHDQRFSRWITTSPLGGISSSSTIIFTDMMSAREMRCREIRNSDRMDFLPHGGKIDTVDFVWCRSFGGVKAGAE